MSKIPFDLGAALQMYGTDTVIGAVLGVAASTVARWRKGEYFPPTSYWGALCAILGCTPEELGDAAVVFHRGTQATP